MASNQIPIIGQPFEVKNWFMVVNLECRRCNTQQLVTLLGLFVQECPNCGTRFQFLSFDLRGQKINAGELGLSIASTAPTKPNAGNGGEGGN